MAQMFRNSVIGRLIQAATGTQWGHHETEPELWHKYISYELSRRMARHGSLEHRTSDEYVGGEVRQAMASQHPTDDEKNAVQVAICATDSYSPYSSTNSSNEYIGELSEQTGRQNVRHELFSDHEIHPEKGRHAHVVHFAPEDSENPRTWSAGKKAFITAQVSLATLGVWIAPSITSAGSQSMEADFNISKVVATLGLTLSVLGMGCGCMVWPAMSEAHKLGRTPIMVGTLLVFVLLQIPTALAPSFWVYIAFRFIAGLFGGALLGVPGGTIADLYSPMERSYVMLIWDVTCTGGPTIGPLIGGFVADATGASAWRWMIWELMIFNAAVLLLMAFCLPETNADTILYHRALKLRNMTGNPRFITGAEFEAEMIGIKETANIILLRPFALLATEPIVLALNVYTGLVNAIQFITLEAYPFIFQGIYGFNIGEMDTTFLGILVGYAAVIPPFIWYLNRYIMPAVNADGDLQPEKRLPPSLLGSIFIPLCLFWIGWTSRPDIHWMVPVVGTSLFGAGSCLLYYSILNYLSDAYPHHTASVFGGNKFLIATVGSGLPLAATPLYENLGVAWASSVLGCICVAFVSIPVLLLIYGRQLRAMSKRARNDI